VLGIIVIVVFLVFIALKMPISFSMGVSTLVGIFLLGSTDFLYIIPIQMIEGTQSYGLMAIPFFILAANLMNQSGITDRIFNFANVVVGHMRGGLAQVNVLASMIFAGISGASVADAAGLGVIEIKAMTDKGYSKGYSAALTIASSLIGPLIPPSIGLVLIGVLANLSIGKLFLGALIPGIMMGLSLMVMNVVFSYTKPDFPQPSKRATLKEIFKTFGAGLIAILAPVFIIGGLIGGFVTATEAGILAVNYVLIASFFYNKPKEVFRSIPKALFDTVKTTAMIMFIIAIATSMTWLFTIERIPIIIANSFLSISNNKYVFLLLLNIFLLIVGAFIEGIPALIILVPLLLPVATEFGIHPLHYAMVVHVNLLIAMTTPPVGILLYIAAGIAKIKLEDIVRDFFPFYIPLLIILFLVTYIPELTLFLPNLFIGK